MAQSPACPASQEHFSFLCSPPSLCVLIQGGTFKHVYNGKGVVTGIKWIPVHFIKQVPSMGVLKALLPTSFPDLSSKRAHLWGSHVAVSGIAVRAGILAVFLGRNQISVAISCPYCGSCHSFKKCHCSSVTRRWLHHKGIARTWTEEKVHAGRNALNSQEGFADGSVDKTVWSGID